MKTDKKLQGRKNRKKGKDFENKVMKDLESKGWIVARWTKNVEFEELPDDDGSPWTQGELVNCKPKFNPFSKSLMMNSGGFPDFIAYQNMVNSKHEALFAEGGVEPFGDIEIRLSGIIGLECKSNGYLDKIEKEKCGWLIENKIFSKIFIAKKGKKRGEIIYEEF